MSNTYHAKPYNPSAEDFYFKTFEEYVDKAAGPCSACGHPVEEYEFHFIDGAHEDAKLFMALSINQSNLHLWFQHFESLSYNDVIKSLYLSEYMSERMEDILGRLSDVDLFKGSAQEYAETYIEETGLLRQTPEELRRYLDTNAFARDMVDIGDVSEVTILGKEYTVHDWP